MTIRLNPADLTTTRSDLGLAIGTDVLAPNGSAANLTNMPADLSGDLRNIALGSAADRITLLNGVVDPLTDETDVSAGTITEEGGTATVGNTHSVDQAWAAQRFTASQSGKITGVKFAVAGRDFGSGCEVRIETSDGSTAPTGTLVDSNAVLTTSARVQAAATTFYEEDFTTSFDVVAGTVYWIVVGRNGSETYGLYRSTAGAVTGTGISLAGSFQAAYELSIKAFIKPGDSINQTFTSTSGGYYSGSSSGDMFDVAGATITTSPSFTDQANSYDNNDATTSYHAGAPSNDYYQIDLGSGVTRSAISYTVGMWNNGISSSYGTVFTYKLQASNDGSSFTDIDSRSSITHSGALASSKIKYSFSKTSAYRYWRFVIVSSNGSYTGVGEIEIEFSVPQDVTLISNAYTATSAPSKTILGFQTVENETITINTDLKGFVSRDGGSNYTEVTLALKTTLGQTGTKYYECVETTLTSTSGSSMVW
ncbi:MAG: discoidin domain-containing protein, partial [Alphaproteobacteria bacterium]|nr:discoidin domain-containing protein [Alphaproteobacteria bacterium]